MLLRRKRPEEVRGINELDRLLALLDSMNAFCKVGRFRDGPHSHNFGTEFGHQVLLVLTGGGVM